MTVCPLPPVPYVPQPPAHAHAFINWTSVALGHFHGVEMFVYAANGDGMDGHVHRYQGHTKMAMGHFHRFIGLTGPPIPLPDGSHYHEIDGLTNDEPFEFKQNYYKTVLSVKRHAHKFAGRTGTGIGYEPPGW